MLITDIKNILQERKSMSLRELAIHFDMEPDAIEPIMDMLQKKNIVSVLDLKCKTCKSSCSGCSVANRPNMLIYQIKK